MTFSATKSLQHTYKFLQFLYNECESEPNKWIKITLNSDSNTHTYSGLDPKETGQESNSGQSADNQKTTFIRPISLLLLDRFTDLIEALVNQMTHSERLERFDMTKSFNEEGLTPFLKALSNNQPKVVIKLLELGVFSASEICQQQSKLVGTSVANESILQLAIRHGQMDVFETCVRVLCEQQVSSSLLKKLLGHENVDRQNLFHLIGSLGEKERVAFSSSRLVDVFGQICQFFKDRDHLDSEFDFQMFLLGLLGAKDKRGK